MIFIHGLNNNLMSKDSQIDLFFMQGPNLNSMLRLLNGEDFNLSIIP